MIKKRLPSVTLLGVDCVNIDRLVDVSQISQRHIEFGDVKLFSSMKSNCSSVVYIPKIASIEEYGRFMMKDLDRYIETSHILVVQHDGFVLNPQAWRDEFLQYDYIGAPWCYDDGLNVGNGGFSLRSKKLLEMLSKDERIAQSHPEDHHIGRTYRRYLERKGIKFAPESLASQFSIEGNIKYGWEWSGQFGFHSYWATDLSHWNVFRNASLLSDAKFILTYLRRHVRLKRKQEFRQKQLSRTCYRMIEESKFLIEEE